jgi:hypothetical protein
LAVITVYKTYQAASGALGDGRLELRLCRSIWRPSIVVMRILSLCDNLVKFGAARHAQIVIYVTLPSQSICIEYDIH